MHKKSKWTDPGIIMTGVLILIAAFILIWWPKDLYISGISVAGWLMFFSYFAWFAISLIYVLWIEKIDKREKEQSMKDNSNVERGAE